MNQVLIYGIVLNTCRLVPDFYEIQPTANAQFGLPNRRAAGEGGAKSFEQLNKMAADRMADGGDAAGGLAGLANLGDIGEMMKDVDAEKLQEMMMEGMKDPAVQEIVRIVIIYVLFLKQRMNCTSSNPIS